ncbi:hypothetical protein F5Y16DRAFT_375485 [Xylariaceae sp. FL0255]|nr:hypothetical protein F5Y16DRAFT_375485 [Xylariaceae sp. FL0255]
MVYERCGCVSCLSCGPPELAALTLCGVRNHASIYGDQTRKRIFGLFDDCEICHDELNNPVWVRTCGHVFCLGCLDRWWDPAQGKCPKCRATCCSDWGFCSHMAESQALHIGLIGQRDLGVELSADS